MIDLFNLNKKLQILVKVITAFSDIYSTLLESCGLRRVEDGSYIVMWNGSL